MNGVYLGHRSMLSIAICVYCFTIDFWADIDIGSQIPVVLELTP